MIKIITGEKGIGKTKLMVKLANENAKVCKGNIVFIDDDNRAMYELDSVIRFINLTDFHVDSHQSFYGFVCGLMAGNYDIQQIFVDGLSSISNLEPELLEVIIREMERIGNENNVDFYICFNSDELQLSEYVLSFAK